MGNFPAGAGSAEKRRIMKNRVIAVLAASTLAAGILAGCGSSSADTKAADTAATEAAATTEAATTEAAPADGDNVIKVAASQTPHSEILAAVKDLLAEEGYDLEVTVFEDYVQPNNVVESDEFDANYFQHVNYLNSFNEENGTHLAIADNGKIHYEPFGIYGGILQTVMQLQSRTTPPMRQELCFFCSRKA